ncbi:MAG: DUF2867 domain-containing protein [Roseibium sp.]|uniref:DUF2867 domain-containing protein n=1 Tax=Roseibium sp. TaxID=1936156 RepID=UPI00263557B3|nr:DUF2867 domain-containing protein [Roseibium sp.]MCV0426368.1 DUF2867 domain-containing protein [Roseibium sp.]
MSQSDMLPDESLLNEYRAPGDFLDTFSVSLKGRPDLQEADIRVLADHILNADIGWMNALLSARDRIARPFGLKTTGDLALEQSGTPLSSREPGDRIGFFKIYNVEDDELILGEDDWHQDFRLAITRRNDSSPRVFASTCCKRHNFFGYAYLALILPFHKKIAATVLDAARARKLRAA